MAKEKNEKKPLIDDCFLFTADFENDQIGNSKLQVLPQTLLFIGDPNTFELNENGPTLYKTNGTGRIKRVADGIKHPKKLTNPKGVEVHTEASGYLGINNNKNAKKTHWTQASRLSCYHRPCPCTT